MPIPTQGHLALAVSDIQDALSLEEAARFAKLVKQIDDYRERSGKPALACAVIESSWPEYEPVRQALKKRAFVEEQLLPETTDSVDKLAKLIEAAMQIGRGPLMERVAVPNPNGGYYMQVRPVTRQIDG